MHSSQQVPYHLYPGLGAAGSARGRNLTLWLYFCRCCWEAAEGECGHQLWSVGLGQCHFSAGGPQETPLPHPLQGL